MAARHGDDALLLLDQLLDRIRACISGTPADTAVSLTINVKRSGEDTLFHLDVQSNDSRTPLSRAEPASSEDLLSQSPQLAAALDHSQDSMEADVDHDADFSDNRMDVDEGDHAASLQCSDSGARTQATSPIDPPSSQSNNIRRSARQQHHPDRLTYLVAASFSLDGSMRQAQEPELPRRKRRARGQRCAVDVHVIILRL
jgi:hypothetical protein